mmetsp:Transcript_128035/g.221225  ORF Transcript_128035/g.221225 Transcript_128035/m.221225 type:complete len:311 (-) Transcript_128035:897-1829(-)
MDAEAFDELGGVISDNDGNDGSDLEVDINPEGEPRVDNEGEQQKGQEQREEQEDDVAALSVAELEVRMLEAEKSLVVDEEDQHADEPPPKERRVSQATIKKAPNKSKYVAHTLGYKLMALRTLEENGGKVRTTARQLGLKDPKQLRNWRNDKEKIIAEVRERLRCNQLGTTRCRVKGGGAKAYHEELELQLVVWLQNEKRVRSVTPKDLWDEAAKRVKALRRDARISERWKQAFKRRHNITFRSSKRLVTRPIVETIFMINGFLTYIRVRGAFFKPTQILNTDECPLSFDGNITRIVVCMQDDGADATKR